jgi:hypothetical protein
MSLSEVITGLESDESVSFSRNGFAVRVLAQKTRKCGKSRVSKFVDTEAIERGRFDILAMEVRRAFDILRRSEALTDGN